MDHVLTLGYGMSRYSDPAAAIAEAAGAALRKAPHPAFALILATDQYEHAAMAAAATGLLGDLPWIGCCCAGVFAGARLLKHGLVVGVVSSPHLAVGIGIDGPVSRDGHRAGRRAVAQALAGLPPARAGHRAIVVLADGVAGNSAAVVRGAAEEAGSGIAWAGGGTGDNLRFAQYANGRAVQDHVVALVIDGPQRFGAGIRHGWRPYGPPTMVTRVRGSTAVELDYEPAFDVYRRTARGRGEVVTPERFSQFAMTHPLGIPQLDGEHVIRDPLSVDPDGGLRCVAEIPDGCVVRVMEGDRSALIAAALDAARTARRSVRGPVGGAFVFNCVSRSVLLGDDAEDELTALQAGLGDGVPMIGGLTYGEIGALHAGIPQFHNKTAVMLALPA